MSWYYKDGEQEIGPVNKAELQALINAKKINSQTLIRSSESSDWKPLSAFVRPKSTPPAEPQAPSQEYPATNDGKESTVNSDATDPPLTTAVCSQCGRSFPKDQVLEYQEQAICGACKPMFVQRMKEGVAVPGSFHYAGFWIRFVAKFIDGIILAVIQWAIFIPLSLMTSPDIGRMSDSDLFMMMGFQQLVGILIPACYNTFFVGKFGATLGKMACRLKVVMPDSSNISYMRALGRNFAEWISAIILMIGYIMAGFDSEKRALHDRICSTRVIRK